MLGINSSFTMDTELIQHFETFPPEVCVTGAVASHLVTPLSDWESRHSPVPSPTRVFVFCQLPSLPLILAITTC